MAKTGSQYLETILTLVHHRLASDDPPPRRLPSTISPHSSLPIFPRSMQLNEGIIDSAAGFRSAVARGQHYRVRLRRPIWGCVDGCHKQLHRQVADDNGIIIAVASSSSRRPLARPPRSPRISADSKSSLTPSRTAGGQRPAAARSGVSNEHHLHHPTNIDNSLSQPSRDNFSSRPRRRRSWGRRYGGTTRPRGRWWCEEW